MPLRARRWNDPRDPGDGFRLLVCRYRPRALPKAEETWDAWWPELGPSRALHAAYYGKGGQAPIGWEEYRRRYDAERPQREARLHELRGRLGRGETVTLLCSSACTDERRCHRTLLRHELLEE